MALFEQRIDAHNGEASVNELPAESRRLLATPPTPDLLQRVRQMLAEGDPVTPTLPEALQTLQGWLPPNPADDTPPQAAARVVVELAKQSGVTFPQVEPEPEWLVSRDDGGLHVRSRERGLQFTAHYETAEAHFGDPWSAVDTAEDIAAHLNGRCTRLYLRLADVVRKYLADGDGDQFDWWPKLGEALMACEEAGDGD